MTDSRFTRRGVLALATAALAGCSSSEETATERDDSGVDAGEDDADTQDGLDRDIPDRDIEPDWDEAAPFRTWLLDSGGNRRFDYTGVFPEGVDLESVLPGFSDVTIDDVDGHLVQSFSQVLLGSFDAESIAADAEAAADAAVSGLYEGYTVIDEELPNGQTRTLAVGGDAIVIADDYEARIDAHLGQGERLEDVDPEFTHLFRKLPHETTVTGQYGAPANSGIDLEELYLWGVSSESPMAEELTWVFVFRREDALTDAALAELEGVTNDVSEVEREGRTATIVGTPPRMQATGDADG